MYYTLNSPLAQILAVQSLIPYLRDDFVSDFENFTTALGRVLSRPTILSIHESIIKLALREELANAAILSSSCVIPNRLIKRGYKFRFPYLEPVLRHTLGKTAS
ncbi:MAG TPA: DUF1731 domain-containing protein [Nitrososphaeraceae archaeon]|nr:DUF1731 domain-containing protein [Nitrososphaeraceae archaeon]